MPELRVVAVSNDGTRLVLKAADSTEYTLPIDERLRAAVRNDRARLGQIEIEVESHLRPARHPGADTRRRLRRGGRPARRHPGRPGTPLRGPGARRARLHGRARPQDPCAPSRREHRAAARRGGAERLLLRGADKDTVQWDSWRRDDGTWEVLLVYRVAGEPHSASWTYDPPRRLVQAVDDEARALIGETDDTPGAELPVRAADRAAAARPAAGPRPGPADAGAPRASARSGDGDRARIAARPPASGSGLADQPAGGGAELPRRHGRPGAAPRAEPPALEPAGGGAEAEEPPAAGGERRCGFRVRGCADAPVGGRPPRPADRDDGPPGRGRRRPARAAGRRCRAGTRSSSAPAARSRSNAGRRRSHDADGPPRAQRRADGAVAAGPGRGASAGLGPGGHRAGRVGGPLAPGPDVQRRRDARDAPAPAPRGPPETPEPQ